MADTRDDYASIPALEALHEWDDGAYTLNDRQGALPRVKVNEISGLLSLGDRDMPNESAFGRVGEIPRFGIAGGKTVTYEGVLQAATLDSLRYQAGLIRAAFAPATEREMRILRHATYGGLDYRFNARCTALDCRESNANFNGQGSPTPWTTPVTAALRLSDPRIYADETLMVESAAGTGAANPSVNVDNPGTAPADPVVRITGPVTGFRISRGGGTLLAVKSTAGIAAGRWWEFNFRERRIYFDTGADITAFLDNGSSNFWDPGVDGARPGVETWTLSQAVGFPGINSRIRVTLSPALW